MAELTTLAVHGVVGGLVATAVMTVFMMTMGDDSPPPTAALWAKYVGDGDPGQYMAQGMILHLVYGISAGAVFAIVLGEPVLDLAEIGTDVVVNLGAGVVYAVLLFVVAMAFWGRIVIGMDADARQMQLMGVFHLVYGVVLGAFVAFVPALV